MSKNLEERARTGDDLTKEIIASRQAYFDKVRRWTRISDQAFLNNSFQ
jgi:TRAP-type mannitol/chloroaromatic compound transport system substrate-binding protein